MTMRIPRWLRFLALVVLGVVLFMGILFSWQHALLYHPRGYGAAESRLLEESKGIRLEFVTNAGRQSAFFVPARDRSEGAPIWVMFSGNASTALDWLHLVRAEALRSQAFLLVDYPGYGFSEGRAGRENTRAAAAGAVAALEKHLGIDSRAMALNAAGQSLGAAAALDFATRHPVRRILLIAPFTSLREVAAHLFARPFGWLVAENFDNRARLAELARAPSPPTIIIFHGTEDELIPLAMSRSLANGQSGMVTLVEIPGAGHNDVVPAAIEPILRWLSGNEAPLKKLGEPR